MLIGTYSTYLLQCTNEQLLINYVLCFLYS